MTYQEFKAHIAEQIKDYLPQTYQDADVSVARVKKNNNQELDGLNIQLAEENACPVIYLNHYYEDYQNGRAMGNILEEIAGCRETYGVKEHFPLEKLFDFEGNQERIIFQVVGRASNEEQLSKIPHRIEQDMALIYKILLDRGEEGMATITIDHALLERMGVDEQTLYQTAMENTVREFPMTFIAMDDVIRETLEQDLFGFSLDTMQDEEMKNFLKEVLQEQTGFPKELSPFYILTNDQKLDGAGVLFYPGVQELVAEKMKGDYFVLPSSIHETLIVPDNGMMDFEALRTMVNEVNQSAVHPAEVLTGQVYSYDCERGCLMTAEERFSQKQQEKTGEKKGILEKLHEKKNAVQKNDLGSQKLKPEPAL